MVFFNIGTIYELNKKLSLNYFNNNIIVLLPKTIIKYYVKRNNYCSLTVTE